MKILILLLSMAAVTTTNPLNKKEKEGCLDIINRWFSQGTPGELDLLVQTEAEIEKGFVDIDAGSERVKYNKEKGIVVLIPKAVEYEELSVTELFEDTAKMSRAFLNSWITLGNSNKFGIAYAAQTDPDEGLQVQFVITMKTNVRADILEEFALIRFRQEMLHFVNRVRFQYKANELVLLEDKEEKEKHNASLTAQEHAKKMVKDNNLLYCAGEQHQFLESAFGMAEKNSLPFAESLAEHVCGNWYAQLEKFKLVNPNVDDYVYFFEFTAMIWQAATKMNIWVHYGIQGDTNVLKIACHYYDVPLDS